MLHIEQYAFLNRWGEAFLVKKNLYNFPVTYTFLYTPLTYQPSNIISLKEYVLKKQKTTNNNYWWRWFPIAYRNKKKS